MTSGTYAFSLLALLAAIGHYIEALSGGFYADNSIDQSVIYQPVSKRERREMQQEILSLLGLHHRPRPHDRDMHNSAPRFMIDLYNSIKEEEETIVYDNHTAVMHEDRTTVKESDMIMSFVNHGRKRRRNRLQRKLRRNMTMVQRFKRRRWRMRRAAHEHGHMRHDKDRRFWFDMTEVPAGESVLTSELRVFKKLYFEDDVGQSSLEGEDDDEEPMEEFMYKITIYQLVQSKDPEDKELVQIDSKIVSSLQTGWLGFNVSRAAVDWITFPKKNYGLYMRIKQFGHDREVLPSHLGLIGTKSEDEHKPFMVTFFQTPIEAPKRTTRAAKKRGRTDVSYREDDSPWNSPKYYDDRSYSRRNCQKRTLYVSFKELGWQDWIIAPDGYAAFFCFGECSFPLNAHMNATNHAIVQTLVHLMHPFKVPKPCCAPTKLAAISVLYFDDNSNVILKKYRNMVVKSCGCH